MISQLTAFDKVIAHFQHHDEKLAKVLSTINISDWLEDRPSSDNFYNLTRNIIYQQLAGKAADVIFTRFQKLVGEVTPAKIITFDDQEFRDVGLSYAKAKYIKDLASKVISGEVVLENINTLDDQSVVNELIKVKGIGVWTAEMFLLFTLHRENIFSYGDLGLKNGFAKLYGIVAPTPTQIGEVVDRWSPYKSYGSIALWHYLDNR